jgi:hypothetical protein
VVSAVVTGEVDTHELATPGLPRNARGNTRRGQHENQNDDTTPTPAHEPLRRSPTTVFSQVTFSPT